MSELASDRFRDLHAEGCFVMPNPFDVGSARLLEALGFTALATTSSGHAASLGRLDGAVTRDELLAHVEAIAGAVDLPLNVDAERGFAEDPAGVARTVELLAAAGAAGCSIEDWDPVAGVIAPVEVATERVAAAAGAARASGLVLTGRAENHIHGVDDLDDTLARLAAYREEGAEVLFAPGLVGEDAITTVVREVGAPVNVLLRPGGPSVADLAGMGVRRISVGGALAWAAYGALADTAAQLGPDGVEAPKLRDLVARAFTPPA